METGNVRAPGSSARLMGKLHLRIANIGSMSDPGKQKPGTELRLETIHCFLSLESLITYVLNKNNLFGITPSLSVIPQLRSSHPVPISHYQ